MIVGLLLFIGQTTTNLFCVLVNPGIPNRKFYISESVMQSIYTYLEYTNSDTFDKYKICKICNIYVPPDQTVIHCEDCNICINGIYLIIIIFRYGSPLSIFRQMCWKKKHYVV